MSMCGGTISTIGVLRPSREKEALAVQVVLGNDMVGWMAYSGMDAEME